MSGKRPAEIDAEAWLLDAEKKLSRARVQFAAKDYGDAISDLQGSEERIAKAIMIAIGMIAQSEEMSAKTDVAFPGVKHKQPEQLSHNWHERLFEDLGGYLDTMEYAGGKFKGKKGGETTAAFWESSVPDWRERLKKARAVKAKPKPTLEELDGILKDCNRLLGELDGMIGRINVPEVKLPGLDLTDDFVRSILKDAGIKLKKSERLAIEEAELPKHAHLLANLGSVMKETSERVSLLMLLAILNVYLYQHHTMGSYPSSQYSETSPMVVRFGELASLLERILERTKRAIKSS